MPLNYYLCVFVSSCWILLLAGTVLAKEASSTPSDSTGAAATSETSESAQEPAIQVGAASQAEPSSNEAVSTSAPEEAPSEVVSVSTPEAAPAGAASLSAPEAAPNEAVSVSRAPGPGQVPSQGEGEKAPVSARPTSVPEFSLPEVVITGENELTIGASRLDRQENDVTLGSHDLTGIERGLNDLPGLNKTMTALSTEEAGPSKDSALVLHLGGGIPGTYGGWGLLGRDFKDIQTLLSGYYSTWAGQTSGPGLDGDQKAGGNLDMRFLPGEKLSFRIEGGYDYNQANLPYENSSSETRQGINFNGEALLKETELSQAQLKVNYTTTQLNGWDQALLSHQANELETQIRWEGENLNPFIENLSVEGGYRYAISNFPLLRGGCL